jgi:excisionase family DNA binding protein
VTTEPPGVWKVAPPILPVMEGVIGEGLLKTDEVAETLSVSDRTVRDLVADGKLAAIRFGPRGHLRFRREDVEALLERARTPVAA